jgi:hypothetical protein
VLQIKSMSDEKTKLLIEIRDELRAMRREAYLRNAAVREKIDGAPSPPKTGSQVLLDGALLLLHESVDELTALVRQEESRRS